jgi:prepilin-type processing-associated H-X9-DG protein
LALHNYAYANKVFPPGTVVKQAGTSFVYSTDGDVWTEAKQTAATVPPAITPGYHGTGFLLRILPYMEFDTIFKQWSFQSPVCGNTAQVTNGPVNVTTAQTEIKALYCPTRRTAFRPGVDSLCTPTTTWTGGGTDYGGCAGRGALFATTGTHALTDPVTTANPFYKIPAGGQYTAALTGDVNVAETTANAPKQNGIFTLPNQSTGFGSIVDGTSNTLMLGELQRITSKTSTGPFNSSSGPEYSHDAWAVGGDATLFTCGDSGAFSTTGGSGSMNNGDFRAPGSEHSGTVNFGMADGSVRSLGATMDADLFALLGSMADRTPAGLKD